MASPVTLMQFSCSLVSSTGATSNPTYTFDAESMPLFSRRLEYTRPTDQGYGGRKINCVLQGFMEGDYHSQVVQKYQQLLNVVRNNDVIFVYLANDQITGQQVPVVNQVRVYMDDFTDPADWKQYNGDYFLAFHYFEKPDFSTIDLGIQASYQPARDPKSIELNPDFPQTYNTQPLPLYTFNPTPLWSSHLKNTRGSFKANNITPTGIKIADEATIVLNGTLYADDYTEMKKKIDALQAAFSFDGTLNFGTWSNVVRVDEIQIPTVFPRNHCEYSVVLKYNTTGIVEFKSRRQIARLHNYPKITELPACGLLRVQQYAPLGQEINYYIFVRAIDETSARTLATNEAAKLILPGGIEIPGGTEGWDDADKSLTVACTKLYTQPQYQNIDPPG